MIQEHQRVRIGEAKGGRQKFRGRTGEVVKIQESRWFDGTYVHVLLDGRQRSRVFWARELEPISGKER